MNRIAHLNSRLRKELFSEASYRSAIHPAIIEKDFWVCWTLKHLFSSFPLRRDIILKGGTSLSKAFHLIDRFSEDIDLILNWELLGFSRDEPWNARSRSAQDKFNRRMNKASDEYIRDMMIPMLKETVLDQTLEGLAIRYNGDQIIGVTYPSSYSHAYVRPEVKIEIGPLAAWMPHVECKVRSYAAEQFPDAFDNIECSIRVISAERTFWEQATILHQEAHRKIGHDHPARYSRHYYDIYRMCLSNVHVAALEQMHLLNSVTDFKKRFYPCTWARYEDAIPGTFRLIPSPQSTSILESDYRSMREMIFGEYPSFKQILETIRILEREINGIS